METLLNTPNIDLYAVLAILGLFGAVEFILGHYHNTQRSKDDWILESVGFFVVAGTKLLIVFLLVTIADGLFPQASNALQHWSLWLSIPFYLFIDDVAQYWYHRSAHEYEWLWKHHRVHHQAEDMGILTAYRNSWVYYLLMPNLWWGGVATYLGLAPAVIFGLIFKQIIVTSTHSTWKWDKVLYRVKALHPVAWVIEHIFITPAFHFAHHGKSQADHISDPNGNFGNTFSLWDQMFGTAKFTRLYPAEFGLQTDPVDPWYAQLLYPFLKSPKEGSEISKSYKKEKHIGQEPLRTTLEAGSYLYCQCGYSSEQPFCNGAHHGSKFKPLVLDIKKSTKVSLCTCKLSKTPPYCDNSHLKMDVNA